MVDLSSDTATRPTEKMRDAISRAQVGDEQRLEDPTVNALIGEVCSRLGKPAGLFLPSGTMCNLIAVRTHTQPGDAAFVGHNCHILRCETGAAAAVSGIVLDVVPSDDGRFGRQQLEPCLYRPNTYTPIPRLVCVEQTHNFAGGAIWPLEQLKEVRELAMERELSVHMDGARLFNAVIGSGVSAREYAAQCDTVWVDFTKGLGAPLGAVLCGPEEFIERARRFKHMFGGALRQAGMMAAGCLYALEHHVERLDDDHRRAQRLANCLSRLPGYVVRPVDTNLIFFQPGVLKPEQFLGEMEKNGIRMSSVGDWVRAVTHLGVTDSDMERTEQALERLVSAKAK